MATGYSIHKRSAEKEALDRWENEGGLLSQNRGYLLDSAGEDYLRHKDQGIPIGRLAERDASENPKSNTRRLPIVDSKRTLAQLVFAV